MLVPEVVEGTIGWLAELVGGGVVLESRQV